MTEQKPEERMDAARAVELLNRGVGAHCFEGIDDDDARDAQLPAQVGEPSLVIGWTDADEAAQESIPRGIAPAWWNGFHFP